MGPSLTIAIGWWFLPIAVTIIAVAAYSLLADHKPAAGYGVIGRGLGNLILAGGLAIIVLLTWLIWAVFAR